MSKAIYYVGIDIAAETFVASVYQSPEKNVITPQDPWANTTDGFTVFKAWLHEHGIYNNNSCLCLEATGVYSEALAHYFVSYGYAVAVEPPLKVKRAFDPVGHKTDAVDSRQIAEYAYRYHDELRYWQPPEAVLEKIKHLLSAREQFTKQKTASKNALHAYQKHVIQVPMIIEAHTQTIKQLDKHIDKIDKELSKLMRQDPDIFNKTRTLMSIPGFGMLLSMNLMAVSKSFTMIDDHKTMAAFLGICPYQHQSGTSVYKRDRCRKYGPLVMRKLLRLAAQSVATHNEQFRMYYLRKCAEGKHKALVLNNIANKLLKVAFSMIKNNMHYTNNYRSVNPMYLSIA